MHTRTHTHTDCMGIGMVHACAAGKQISGQETHERKWQTGVRYAPAKKRKKYHIQKKFCLLFESFQVKLASECMCVCAINTYTRVQPTHPVHTHTKEASIHAKNKHHTHTPQTTAHQLHTHRQSSKSVCMPYTGENKRDSAISP